MSTKQSLSKALKYSDVEFVFRPDSESPCVLVVVNTVDGPDDQAVHVTPTDSDPSLDDWDLAEALTLVRGECECSESELVDLILKQLPPSFWGW